jgi:SsrA-binding protein
MAKGGKKKRSGDVPEGAQRIATNRRARFDYQIDETVEAGLVLVGTEVKSLREGKVQFKDSFARLQGDEVFLVGMHIPPYSHAGDLMNHNPDRTRKLLLHRHEIDRLMGKIREKGYTLIPMALYFKKGRAKVALGLARGKRQYDKRETKRAQAAQRDIDRAANKR